MYNNATENTVVGRIDAARRRKARAYGTAPDCRVCAFAKVSKTGMVYCAKGRWWYSKDAIYVYPSVNVFMSTERRYAEGCAVYNDMRKEDDDAVSTVA